MKSPFQPEIGKFYDEKVKAKLVFSRLVSKVVYIAILRHLSFRQHIGCILFQLLGLKYGLDDNDIISA